MSQGKITLLHRVINRGFNLVCHSVEIPCVTHQRIFIMPVTIMQLLNIIYETTITPESDVITYTTTKSITTVILLQYV